MTSFFSGNLAVTFLVPYPFSIRKPLVKILSSFDNILIIFYQNMGVIHDVSAMCAYNKYFDSIL